MNYNNEIEGQIDFYKKYLKRIDNTLSIDNILQDNTDGIINGNIIEFKIIINDVNSTLYQTIKYLSHMRIKGKSIPKNIILVSLNTNTVYIFNSEDYLEDIEKLYIGSASKNNSGFQIKSKINKLNISDDIDIEKLIKILKEKKYTKINLNADCIIGWAERYYKEKIGAKKSDFIGDDKSSIKIIGEIRRPTIFKEYINVYKQSSNVKFKYLMDKLNDKLTQKNTGAFYTPPKYAELGVELIREAIKKVPKDNDYIILDRCAGTGNLEQYLTDEELDHCILSTYEYYEYKVLVELLGDKVRHIIPSFESADVFDNGTVLGANALTEDYINNKTIQQYIKNEKCTIIMLENPPYREAGGKGEKATFKNEYLFKEMSKEKKGVVLNDLANIFIWSAFKYYLRQQTDSYIIYSPLKYFKQQNLINKKFIKGYGLNRKHFHAQPNTISCILWSNIDQNINEIKLDAFNIDEKNNQLINEGEIVVKKVKKTISQLFPKIKGKRINPEIVCDTNGKELKKDTVISVKIIKDLKYIGYLVADGFGIDNPGQGSLLLRLPKYNAHGQFITKEDYFQKLPLLAAGKYYELNKDWKIMGSICKTSDGKEKYFNDIKDNKINNWLLKILFWTCLFNNSKLMTINGSDDKLYQNELSLDNTNGMTLALEKLQLLKYNKIENDLLCLWNKILIQAKQTKNYNKKINYNPYQIDIELNTTYQDINSNGKEIKIHNYPELNGNLNTLKVELKEYYLKEIVPTLFEYELLK